MILFFVVVKSLIPVSGVLQTEETRVKRPYNIHTVLKDQINTRRGQQTSRTGFSDVALQ